MQLLNLIDDLLIHKNKELAVSMCAYMRNQFQYLGIPTPLRRKICKVYFNEAKKLKKIEWKFIKTCWDNPYREMQYIAVDYLTIMKDFLTIQDVSKIRKLAITKSWWDTIDGLDKIIGDIALSYPDVSEIMISWSQDENIWLRRIAIDHQLNRKNKTNTELLEKIIANNFGVDEFFINKAIGWSLREYSKINPQWVKCFIKKHKEQLSPLSIKEGSKYI